VKHFTNTLTVVGILALATASADAAIRVIDMDIQSRATDQFGFGTLSAASQNPNRRGRVLGSFTGTFRVEWDDAGTESMSDDTLTISRFEADIFRNGEGMDMRLDSNRSESSFLIDNDMTSEGGHHLGGSLHIEALDHDNEWHSMAFEFDTANAIDRLASQFFAPEGADRNGEFALDLRGIATNDFGFMNYNGDIEFQVFASGRLIPMPTPFAMAGLGLLGVGASLRRRRGQLG